jgi:7-cyano-7-deazaguanine synthase
MKTAVVLMSGGLRSAVTACVAKEEYDLALLHVTFGQRTAEREQQAVEEIAAHLKVTHSLVTELPFPGEIGGNARVDKKIPIEDAAAIGPNVPNTFVPGLMPSILGIATGWAANLRAERIFVGVSEKSIGNARPGGALYPDHRREFYQRYGYLLETALPGKTRIKIDIPLIDFSEKDTLRLGAKLKTPFHLTWSCLRNSDSPCGSCCGCASRAEAFVGAGAIDPIAAVAATAG